MISKLMDVLQKNISEAITPKEKSADGNDLEESVEVRRTNAICTTELYEQHMQAVHRIDKANVSV